MAISQINGQAVTINSTKNNGGSSIGSNANRNNMSSISTGNNQYNGSSVVIDSTNTDPADSSGIFAYNNNRPTIMPYTNSLATVTKKIYGNNSVSNRSRTISGPLTATSIRQGKYNFYNNTFDANYPETSSYNLCPDVLTTTYQLGQQSPEVKNDNPSSCDQNELNQSEPTPLTLEFLISSDSNNSMGYMVLGTPIGQTQQITAEYDYDGQTYTLVSDIIPQTTTYNIHTELFPSGLVDGSGNEINDVNVPFRLTFSNPNGITNFFWEVGEESYDGGYNVWDWPENLSELPSSTNFRATFHSDVSESGINLNNLNINTFRYNNDLELNTVNLSGATLNEIEFDDCANLTEITVEDIVVASNGGSISFNNCDLNESSITALLLALDASNISGGYLDVSGGTNWIIPYSGSARYALDGLNNKDWELYWNEPE